MATEKTQNIRDTFMNVMGASYSDIVDSVNALKANIVKIAKIAGKYEIHQVDSNFFMSFNVKNEDTIENDIWILALTVSQTLSNRKNTMNGDARYNAIGTTQFLKELTR